MAFMVNFHSLCSLKTHTSQTLAFWSHLSSSSAAAASCDSILKLNKRSMIPVLQTKKFNSRICAAQSNFFKVIQTAYKVGKDGIEAGTSLVPESVPRPIARISVAVIGASVALFFLKSFLSTAFFVLATMGLIYSAFIALNKDEGLTGGGGTTTTGTNNSTEDETLEEARRIMEKYK